MLSFIQTARRLTHDREAVTALEYGLVAALVAGTVAMGFSTLASNLSDNFAFLGACVSDPLGCIQTLGGGGQQITPVG